MLNVLENLSENYHHAAAWDSPIPPLVVHQMFFDTAKQNKKRNFLHFMGRSFSYAAIEASTRQFAKAMQMLGAEKGDRVGLFLPNVPHYAIAYYGALAAGMAVVNFSPLYSTDELKHQVEDSGIDTLVTISAEALLPQALAVLKGSSLKRLIVGNIAEMLPMLKRIAYPVFKHKDIATIPVHDDILYFQDILKNDGNYTPVEIDPVKDVALIQYTGGTTGTPKGAMLTHQNITANAQQINLVDPYQGTDDRVLGALPFFHVFANAAVLNRSVLRGAEIILMPRFETDAVLKAIEKHRVTAFAGVPTMYQALLDHKDSTATDFSSLRVCVSGGAPLSIELQRKFQITTKTKIVEGYGLTESSGVVSVNPYEGLSKIGTIGQPMAQTIVKIVDKTDPTKAPPPGEPGELVIKGPQIMKGYWQKPDANKECFVDGFLRTGDVACFDEDGYITIVDRLKDMISVGGFKVFPSRIEKILYQHPTVREALVIGRHCSMMGEKPVAYISLQEDTANISPSTILTWINERVGKHEKVLEVIILDTLPKTMIGKLDRKGLRPLEEAHTPKPTAEPQ